MAIRSSDQISIVDVTDAYSVILTSDSHTFPGSTSAALAGSVTTQVVAMRGAEQVAAKVTVSAITKPSGVTVTSNNDSTAPTLTISVTTSVTSGGVVKIPVQIGDITINKEFTYAIAFKGATGATGATGKGISSTVVEYQKSASGTTVPTGTWSTTIPTVGASEYLWTRTTINYTEGNPTKSYSVGMMGATGAKGDTGATGATGKGVSSTLVEYQKSTSGTTVPTGTWSTTIPTVGASEYLWTRTTINYTEGDPTKSYSVGMMGATGAKGDKGDTGATGAAGADAITMSVTSSNGTIFKNSAIATVLTAHVYKAGVELNASQIAALGTIKWYKDGATTAHATGATLTIDAGDITNKATFVAQLEG